MSFLRRLAASLGDVRGANPLLPWGDSTPPSNSMLGGNYGGVSVTQQSAIQVAAVYGSVALLSDSLSSLPNRLLDGPSLATAKQLPDSPLITEPYVEIDATDWWTQFVWSLALRGNFYGHVLSRDRRLYPTQIKPISPDHVQIRRDGSGSLEYRFYGRKVSLDDVVHVRYQTTPGTVIGLNPIEYLRSAFGQARAMDIYAEMYFQNSANPSVVISVPGQLTPDETKAMLRNWVASHQGLNQAHLPGILTDNATLTPITISPQDSQFLQTRQFSENVIVGRVFRIPPHMVGIVDRTTSWGTGIEQQERGFTMNTLRPYIWRGQRLMTKCHPPGVFGNFDLSERLRGDSLQRAQAGSLMMLAGAWNADEVRSTFDMPPVPGGKGKNFYVPINTELLALALQQLKAAQDAAKNPQAALAVPPEEEPPPSTNGHRAAILV